APQHEIEIVRGLHRGGREPDAAADLLAQITGNVPAHQRTHRSSDRAVADRLAHIRELGIEPLRIADRELELAFSGERDELIGLAKIERDRLLEENVLAC